jgi:hypothetical protein
MNTELLQCDEWVPDISLAPIGKHAVCSVVENAARADVVVYQRIGNAQFLQGGATVVEKIANLVEARRRKWGNLGADLLAHCAVKVVDDLVDMGAEGSGAMVRTPNGKQFNRLSGQLLLKMSEPIGCAPEVIERV